MGGDFIVQGIQVFRLDGDQDGLAFQPLGRQEVVVPDDFIQREGDMLLGFKPDELFNVRVVQGGKLDKADENGLSGYGIIGNAAFDAELLDEVGDGLPHFCQAHAFCGRIQYDETRSVAVQDEVVFIRLGKDAH